MQFLCHPLDASHLFPRANFPKLWRGAGQHLDCTVTLIVNGFVRDVLQQLPMEFAVEAQKLISISLEGSVG